MHIHVHVNANSSHLHGGEGHAGWRTCIGCILSTGYFPQKRFMISGSFAERDLQPEASYASWPLCIHIYAYVCIYTYMYMHVYICVYV